MRISDWSSDVCSSDLMTSPGIEIRPIRSIDGLHHLNEIFFTDLRVPATNLVGPENGGWAVAKFLLEHERSGSVGSALTLQKQVDQVRAVIDGGFDLKNTEQAREFDTLDQDRKSTRLHSSQ